MREGKNCPIHLVPTNDSADMSSHRYNQLAGFFAKHM